eukprot:1149591-Pelagomonas_calceolata.AAC.3
MRLPHAVSCAGPLCGPESESRSERKTTRKDLREYVRGMCGSANFALHKPIITSCVCFNQACSPRGFAQSFCDHPAGYDMASSFYTGENFGRGHNRLHAAFIDFKQAYDTIPREALWAHLQHIRIPACLLAILKSIYDNDEYVLMDGYKQAQVHPRLGVEQGCPLSPSLFSLCINDIDCLADNVQGAVTGASDVRVTHMLYADDLTANHPTELQIMLDSVHRYAQRKGLIINVSKSEVVHFNLKGNNIPIFPLASL